MRLRPNISLLLIMVIMIGIHMESIGIHATADNSQIARQVHVVHDTLRKVVGNPQHPVKLHKRRSPSYKTKSIPADDIHDPENVEEALEEERIQRPSRRDPRGKTLVGLPNALEDADNLKEERTHDLEEIFQILARRDGRLLEQMLSLKSAIERLYGIFEFMGVANLPQSQRDAAVRKVLERSFKVEYAKRARRMRLV